MMRRLLCAFACLLFAAAAVAQPVDWRERAQTAIHMLDYVGVDYPEFVRDGKVLDEEEYQEQLEFTQQVVAILQELPENPRRAALVAAAERLAQAVTAKAPGAEVSEASGTLRRAIMDAYELAAAPKQAPDAARGAALYAELCAACHGAEGRGDGPAGKGLEPPPSDFHDAARMASRSVYGLYNTITLGVAGTGMAAYNQLSEDDRWALAFHVSRFALNDADLARAEAAWRSGEHAGTFSSLREVVSLSTEEVRARHGDAAALAHLWLRAHPEALAEGRPSPLRFAAQALRESDAAYRAGERERAHQLAITAYLEGFELVEASLDNVDAALRATVEREMMTHRTLMKSGAAPEAVAAQTARVLELLEAAREKLEAGALSPGATFAASFLILLREGFEAILVLAAIVTFLVKSGRRDALPWVHAGWAAALLLGAATWFAATHLIDISGADRELTEGITALVAAAMLLYVGIWLHSKAHSQAWQRYIGERLDAALAKRTLWAMAAVAFLAVYRELFEIVLFYQALAAQAGGASALYAGMGAAAVLLAAIAWAIFRYGLRLPIGPFFTVTAALLAVLAVVFAGQGVAALQEAGAIDVDAVPFIRVPALGIYPTLQTLGAQALAAALVAIGFYAAGRRRHRVT